MRNYLWWNICKTTRLIFESRFFERLRSKGRYQEYVDKVPILLSYDKNNGLKGAAEAFYNPFFKNKTF